jgi:asparagine synthase (glutamine-hydrolysing)
VVRDNIKLRLLEDVFANSIPCISRYEDRNTMRFSIEGRLPFLDKELLRLVWSLDEEAIIKGSWNKRILRDAMLPYLPQEVSARRNKIGFSTPEVEWFGYLKEKFQEIFISESFASRRYFNVEIARQAFQAFCEGRGDATTLAFWRMLHLELWLRMFIDAPLPPTPDEPPHPRGGELKRTDPLVLPILATAPAAPAAFSTAAPPAPLTAPPNGRP